jgi:hypothetical protein
LLATENEVWRSKLAQYQILAGIDPSVLRSDHMRRGDAPDDEQADHRERHRQPRRPWFLIAACLTLVVLSAVLWVKWSDNRREAARLQRELTRVYKEAEDLRMQAALGQERIVRLERELRALKAESQARPAEDKKAGRSAPKR